MAMKGEIFTNADYAIIKEHDCYAYQVISNSDGHIKAVQLKLKTVAPTRLKIDKLSSCGMKKIHYPLIQTDVIETFNITTFGKRKCIMNKDKCLIQFIHKTESPKYIIDNPQMNQKVELEILPITLIKDVIVKDSQLIRACKLSFNYNPIVIIEPVIFIEPTDTIEWKTCFDEAHSSVKEELYKLNNKKNEKEEELRKLNIKIQNLTVESYEQCKHHIKTIEYTNLNCKINYCTYCKIKMVDNK